MATTAMFAYPWEIVDHGVAHVAEQLAAIGIDEVWLAVSYHEAWLLHPSNPQRRFTAVEPGILFPPDPQLWSTGTPRPVRSNMADDADVIRTGRPVLAEAGITLRAWTVCFNAPNVARATQTAQVHSRLGVVPQNFCIRSPQAQAYARALVLEAAARSESVVLESCHWGAPPSADRLKNGAGATDMARHLLSWCTCARCLEAVSRLGDADRLTLDLDRLVDRLLAGAFASMDFMAPSDWLALAMDQVPDLPALLTARQDAVAALVRRLADLAPLEFLVMGDRDTTGVDDVRLAPHLERLHYLLYAPPQGLEDVVEAVQARGVELPHVGVCLSLLEGDRAGSRPMQDDVRRALDMGVEHLTFYNLGLATAGRLDELEAGLRHVRARASGTTAERGYG